MAGAESGSVLMAAAPTASNRRDTFTFINSAAARWETAPYDQLVIRRIMISAAL